ncbi:helicase POLQ-like isoform X1 [Schistocerca cancellata]|uniref:helicase POLQ-like isoform X1 n=2 Tax=Schistocerca cancellata TaxID=274614 RepID=UPI002118BA8D|nr:helicase POLQ-like isoform X1 [Schistocerca cancellata]
MTDKKIMKLSIRHKEANIDMGYVKCSSKSKSCSNLGKCEEAVLEGTQVNILDISMCQLPTTTALPLSESTPRRKRSTVNDSVEYKSKRRVSQQTKETGNVSQLLKTDQALFSTLIENITPIRNSKQKRIITKKSPVSRRLREKLFKNVNGNLCPSISTETISFTQKQMLTQDDSVLQAIDLGIVETKETGTDEIPDELKNLFASQGFDTCATNVGEFECANDTEQRIVNHNEIHDNLKDLSINWTNESMIHSVLNENKSKCIGLEQTPAITMQEKIRQALVMNAQKPVTPKLFCNENTSVDSSKDLSRLDGPFFGLPKKVESLIKSCKGIDKLYEWQEECLNLKALNDGKNLVYALPTSGGKTLVAEILIFREILCHRRNAIFVLPYVSIVQEKVRSMAPFAVDLDFMLEEYAAGKGQYPPTKRRKRHSVYIATMEKALGIVNSLLETKRMEEIGLVVVDELHLIGDTDSSRSATLEILLTKLRFSARHVQIVGMSATIGNIQEVATFLNAEIYSRNFRPVELKEYVKCERNIFEVNSKLKGSEEMLSLVRTMDMPPPSCNGDQDHIARLVCEVIPHDSCLVFCATKKNCENVALLVSKNLPREILDHRKEEKQALIRTLISELNGSLCPVLQKTLPYGMGYHHSGLTVDERRLLEEAFLVGTLCCLFCTSTLAAGVNLPAKRVILRSPYVGQKFLSPSRYKQMIGRAGRAGFGASGESILICKPSEVHMVNSLIQSPVDDACSTLHKPDNVGLQTLMLSAIGLGLATTRARLHDLARTTLLSVQEKRLEVDVLQLTDAAVSHLVRTGAVAIVSSPAVVNESDVLSVSMPTACNVSSSKRKSRVTLHSETELTVSKLGRAAMKGPIPLHNVQQLKSDLVQAQASLVLLTCLHLLYLVTPYDMVNQITPIPNIYFSVCERLNKKDWQTARVIGFSEATMVKIMKGQRIKSLPERVIKRFYLTLIIYELWNETPVWMVAEKFQLPRGFVQTLMVNSSTFASCVMRFCEELPEFWAFKDLLSSFTQRLSHCCTLELIPLMELPAVKRGRAKQLYNAGFKTITDVANADPKQLVRMVDHLPTRVAKQIVSAAKMLLIQKAETLREEAESVLDGLNIEVKGEVEEET